MANHTGYENKRIMRRMLILLAAVITAIAVAVACALCLDFSSPTVDVDNVEVGEVESSTTYTNKTGNLTATGVIANGDILNYSYTGTVVSVTLPKGTYDFVAYGAQGGTAVDYRGGYGGYSKGRFEVTATSQTIYICIGGQGGTTKNSTSVYAAGGYNGGGRGYPSGGNTSNTQTSGGGGGATHVATTNRGLLSAYANYKSEIIMVAGGGGGGGAWYGNASERSAGGEGGGTSGGAAKNALGNSAAGGTQTTGYAFGLGGTGAHADQGGGGGGYYGGYAQTTKSDAYISGGGGGSGYVNTSKLTNSPTTTTSTHTGNGSFSITVVNVNKPPATKSLTKSVGARGTASVAINASDIASDPEGTNVYFTDGTASNLDTFTTTANKSLYIDSACTKLATDYFDWTWTNNTQFKITNIKRYPRSGVDGSTANGSIKLYAKVRDNYGTNLQRGWAVIPFTVTVSVTSVSQAKTTPALITTDVGNGYGYYLGNSNIAAAPEGDLSASTVYNPNGTGRYTVMLAESLRKDTTFTIKASDLVAGVYSGDTVAIALNSTTALTGNTKFQIDEYTNQTNKVTAYNVNRVAIANAFSQLSFRCLTPEPGFQVFSVTLYVLEKTTAYGTANVVPGCVSIPLDIVFKMDNTRPVLRDGADVTPVVSVNTLQSVTVDINTFFRDADTSQITSSTHQISKIVVPEREFVQLDKYGNIVPTVIANTAVDASLRGKSYFNVLPGNAAINTSDALTDSLSTGMYAGSTYATGFDPSYISTVASNTAFVQYSINNNNNNKLTITFTGLRATYSMYNSTRQGSRFATGQDNNGNITTSTGALNVGDFYVLVNILDRNDTSDAGIWLPLGIKVNNVAPTDLSRERGATGASVMPTASGDPEKSFYFTPMGITVDRETFAIGARLEGGSLITSDVFPLAADADNFFVSNMLNGASLGMGGDTGVLNELVTITSTAAAVQNSVTGNTDGTFFTVSTEPIYIPYDYFGGRVKYSADIGTKQTINGDEYVVINGLKITLKDWTHNRYLYASVDLKDSAGSAVTGVRIAINVTNAAPKSFTADDADAKKVALINYAANGMSVKSEYNPAGENGVATIEYSIPMHSTIVVTPYDLLIDPNMTASYPTGGFTLNGLSGVYNETTKLFTVNGSANNGTKVISGLANGYNAIDYSDADNYVSQLKTTLTALQKTRSFDNSLSSGNLFTSAAEQTKTTFVDRLYFERNSDSGALDGYSFNPYASYNDINDFAMPVMPNTGFISYKFGSTLQFNGEKDVYNLDYIIITAESRTQAGAPVEITLNVRDRTGAGASGASSGVTSIKIVINVINSSPRVQYPDKVYTLSTNPVATGSLPDATGSIKDTEGELNIIPSTLVINASMYDREEEYYKNFLIDNEGDTVMFYPNASVTVVDGDGNTVDGFNNDYNGKYVSVSISSTQLTITALNSTQSVKQLFVEFSVTDGRYNGNTLEVFRCRIQIEILNAKMSINYGDDGFTTDEQLTDLNLWTVETLDNSDITKARYFASSEDAVTALSNSGMSADQIKRLTNDSDALQGVVLSPVDSENNVDSGRGYYVADMTAGKESSLKNAVPYARLGSNLSNTAVAVYINMYGNDDTDISKFLDEDGIDILYFVNGNTYSAKELRNGGYGDVVSQHPDWFFDANGRWVVRDWAVVINPKSSTANNQYIQINLMVSDEARYGGGTWAQNSAFKNNQSASVDGYSLLRFHMAINSLGIIPYTYYDQFDGYYTVRVSDANANTVVNYVPTYDGNTSSIYQSTQNSVYLTADNKISTTSGTLLKSRSGGTTDDTLAGRNSGAVYGSEVNYENDEAPFKYTNTISVPASSNEYTAVPMSYFGLTRGLVSADATGAVVYPTDEYVSYYLPDVQDGYGRMDITAIANAISISDGINTWKGDSFSQNPLASNPYVNITAYDALTIGGVDTSAASEYSRKYLNALNGPYFNKALSVSTSNSQGVQAGYFVTDGGALTAASAANAKNLVGANGELMYLAEQTTKLQENMFGLAFAKKNTRSSAASLTVSIDIALCQPNNDGKTETKEASTAVTVTFKLDIANSPVTLVKAEGETGILTDTTKGYYTDVRINTSTTDYTIALERLGVAAKNVDRIIRYDDDDKVVNGDNTIDESKSDKAYFYADSLNMLSSWGGGNSAYYERAMSYDDSKDNLVFDYTSTDNVAQNSMRNYFGTRNDSYVFSVATKSSMVQKVTPAFQANGGIYGSNISNNPNGTEGFSRFFNVSVASDGSSLTIVPLAKTTLNSDAVPTNNTQMLQYYNQRGLEWDATLKKGYYPLKIMIYDSHGDGFMYGSYVSLEIRVYIDSSAPTLSTNLENDTALGAKSGDKKVDVALSVGQSYIFSLPDVILSDTLLKTEKSEIFWKSDYEALKNKDGKTDEDLFKLDTGTYLVSPFTDTNYGWRKTSNADLRAGNAKLYDTMTEDKAVQPDVVMSMEYTGGTVSGGKTVLGTQSVPKGNAVTVTVNRRSTYESKQYKNFTFKIVFTDSDGNKTGTLSVNVEVVNQAPTIRSTVLENATHLKMRVGDSFTVVTTPYDRFVGTADNGGNKVSAEASTSYKTIMNNPGSIVDRNLLKKSGDEGYLTSVKFSDLTTTNVDFNAKYTLHDYDPDNIATQHLGYLAIADDDTPWALRIVDVKYYDDTCFRLAHLYDQIPLEGETVNAYALDTVIEASSVCTDMPITITVMDAERATATFTIYVTVESSKPMPIQDGDNIHRRHEGLITTYTDKNNTVENIGVYEMYMSAYNGTAEYRDVNVNNPAALNGVEKISHVYGEATFNVNQIAYDPDTADNNEIALYAENNNAEYDVFTFNNMPMSRVDGDPYTYYNDFFTIKVARDFKSFTIRCETYNPNYDWDELKFFVRDVGNNVFANAAAVTFRISTINSTMTNDHQAAIGNVSSGVINSAAVDTVYVKPYDDYVGASKYTQELPDEEKYNVINVPSTYQMFNYKDVADSIDQPNTDGWGINDGDVVNSTYNLNYGIRVYAFMEPLENNARVYNSLPLNTVSSLFFENQSAASSMMQSHYWYLRDTNSVSKYFISGVRAGGGMISNTNSSLNMFLQQYFLFEIGEDGVSLRFKPVTSNLNLNILFYVEFEKDISSRTITRAGASTRAGTLFYVSVKDSAPTENTENKDIHNFTGKINDSNVFTVFDAENAYGSLFNDSDVADVVTLKAFTSNANAEEDYKTALAEADCDWQARNGVRRAIDIAVNNSDEEANGLPAHSLKVTIVRRIDQKDEDGNYLTEVTLPIIITGYDSAGQSVSTIINVTVQNSDMSFNDEKLADEPTKYDDFGAGYKFSYDEEKDMYVFDAYVAPDSDKLTMNLVLESWLKDADFTSMSADTDSYKLAKPIDTLNVDQYMYNDAIEVYPAEGDSSIAVITPIFGNNNQNVDFDHFAGFTITATSYVRGVTGVAYMRIIDRSANALDKDLGIVIMVNVTVLNAAPNVKLGMDKVQYTIIGSDSKNSEATVLDISQFVEDRNNDAVRIFGIAPLPATNVHCSAEEENGGNILRVSISESNNQLCSVLARKGFYGTQSVLVTVADGDLATDLSARTVMFTVTFNVVYDFNQVSELNNVSAIRSLPVKITPEKLFMDVTDTFDETYVSSGNDGGRNILMSAEGDKTFNPGNDYVIDSLTANEPMVTINKDADGDWQFVCTREVDQLNFNVTFIRKVDVGNPDAQKFSKTFTASVGKNSSPVLIEQIRRNEEFTFHTREGEYGLDSNGTVTLTTAMLFSDIDIANGDSLVFDPEVTGVVSGTMCSVRISEDGLMLYLTFNTRGETDFTVGVKDKTGETVKATFKIKNIDRPTPSFMQTIKISYETYPYIWLGVAVGVLVLIALIILLVILLKRRKRKQEELEAILVSEMELEEQMMRLAGGAGAAPYQSFGYLPPTMPVQNDPGLMIGGGAGAPQNDVIGLNPGEGGNSNNM